MNYSVRLGRIRFAAATLFVVLGASCPAEEPTRLVFIADSGNKASSSGPEKKVADMIKAWNPDFIVAAGDLAYEKGSKTVNVFKGDPIKCYGDFIKSPAEDPDGTKTRFFPAMGNHEYTYEGGGKNETRLKFYKETFAVPSGEGGHEYYEYARGPVRIFILDSNEEGDGSETGSNQHEWFKKQVPKAGEKWKFAVYHHSAWTSGKSHDSGPPEIRKWEFEKSGITASIGGHSHVYERVMKGSFPFFTIGLSGVGAYPFVKPYVEGSKVRLGRDEATMTPAPEKKNGALFCEATEDKLVMEFWTISGEMADRWPESTDGLIRKPTQP